MKSVARAFLLVVLITSTCSISLANKPQRIVSLSLCTDQLLLMLVDKKRIAALSHLATDPLYSYMWQASQGIYLHHNRAEEIVPVNPDLIIAAPFTLGNTRQMLDRLGYPVVTFPTPETLADVEELTRAVGKAVNEPMAAEAVIKQMHHDINKAKQLVANKPKLLAISYGPNGFTAGSNTLKNEVLKAAGLRNLAAQMGINYFGNISLEQLVLSNPDIVIIDDDTNNQNSLAQNTVSHPALKRLFKGKTQPNLPMSYWICPGPIASKAILALAEQRQ